MYEFQTKVFIKVDDDGFEIEPVIFNLYDESGNPITEIPSNLVPPNQKRLFTPKWNFETKDWEEGNMELALSETKRMLTIQYNIECTAYIENGFFYNDDFFSFSMAKDQANFSQQLTFLLARPDITEVLWKTENNGVKTFTRDEFMAICGAGEQWKRTNMSKYWQLEAYIESLTDLEELNSLGTFEEAIQKLN
ncbi:hypothetical protein ABFY54_29070 [Priestia megaterium]|uniref:DUF4376 domain-containing protein n=1 Tax=Priestia megaterium TaxID=1404 RepID=UPI003D2D5693